MSQSDFLSYRRANTLKKVVSFSGVGIHTGENVSLRFVPAAENTGIVFKRVDLEGQPLIPALVDHVKDTRRCTTIGTDAFHIHTVEHVLAAIHALHIDNLIVELDGSEPPVGNGSSDIFVSMIEEAGIEEQEEKVKIFKIQEPLYYADDSIQIVALPYDGYRISYTLNYPKPEILRAQFHSADVTAKNFKENIASCRTFSLYEEVQYLIQQGLIKGGSLDNAVVIKDNEAICKGGLFFPNEMARHKVLDMIGDLSLVGYPFEAHIIAIRAGHHSNFMFAKKLSQYITSRMGDQL